MTLRVDFYRYILGLSPPGGSPGGPPPWSPPALPPVLPPALLPALPPALPLALPPALPPAPSPPPGFGGPGGPLGFHPGGVAKCHGSVLGDCPMYLGRELPRLIGFVGEKDPLGGPLGVPSSLGGRWGVGVGGVWNMSLSPFVGDGVVVSIVEGPATFVGSFTPCSWARKMLVDAFWSVFMRSISARILVISAVINIDILFPMLSSLERSTCWCSRVP